MTIQRALAALGISDRSGRDQWTVKCPNHADRTPSLSVRVDDATGNLLLNCHAGCETSDVIKTLRLGWEDLFAEPVRTERSPLRRFDYCDGNGTILYRVERYDEKGKGGWLMRHPAETGWTLGRGPSPPVLYRLPELLRNPDMPVFITEGERDADTLAAACGLVTTTVASGAWSEVDLSPLKGRFVWVVVDNDRAGWNKGQQLVILLNEAGIIVDDVWRPLDQFKDVTEAIGHGKDCETGFVYEVDLFRDSPPLEKWEIEEQPLQPVFRETGEAFYKRVPHGAFFSLMQAGELEPLDMAVWALHADRAGRTGVAHLTAADAGMLLGIYDKAIRNSFTRLEKCGLIRKVQRGRYQVRNPCYIDSPALVPLPTHYANKPAQTTSPFFPPCLPNHVSREPSLSTASSVQVDRFATGEPALSTVSPEEER